MPGRLREIRIRNLGVIDDAVLELAEGLNVLSGETGAGKTMVVSGLGLLLGARADGGLVRVGAASAIVEGVVELGLDHPALVRAQEAGAEVTDPAEGLLLARSVGADGRSRAYAGGRQTPVGVLAEIGRDLVAVHGQADQWRLRRPEHHRALLDGYGGPRLAEHAARYRETYAELAELRTELERLRDLDRDRLLETSVLTAGLEELEALEPQPGEDRELALEEERLANADALREGAALARGALTGSDDAEAAEVGATNVMELLDRARSALAGAAAHDPGLEGVAARLDGAAYLVGDIGGELAGYLAGVEGDPARLAAVQQRRADLTRLTRAYGGDVDAALAWGARAAARLTELDHAHDRAGELQARHDELVTALGRAATALSAARREAASRLAEAITAELTQLAMPRAAIEVAVEQTPQAPGSADNGAGLAVPGFDGPLRHGPHGIDDVEIRLAANSGAPARSVAKAASGGELSRVMLAIEVVTAGVAREHLTTFVFDEVDAGVGGAAALAIGARLAALAAHTQVIVVTHLAQVAAYADRHIVVRKDTASPQGSAEGQGQVTVSDLAVVEGADRLRELARMMAGSADSAAGLEHARDLLRGAREGRVGVGRPIT